MGKDLSSNLSSELLGILLVEVRGSHAATGVAVLLTDPTKREPDDFVSD